MYFAHFVLFIILISLTSGGIEKVSIRGYDPGKCNRKNHGKLTMVKDRQENDKLLVCAKENKVYVWKTTDGSNPGGEFFNPGFDCSDVLNKISEAKDGFYWITLSGVTPKKVWCDMSTDGGGWVLVGHKNNSVTWTVPSNSKPVEPFGEPHWSSSLGDAQVVDFRVQVATKEDFKSTRAHWSFRLRKQRALKNLLIINKGGCGRLSPGIGDISSVKDLQTEEIVSTKFRCSNFGTYYPRSSRHGWDMMNYCLEHPCPYGFAFHHKYPIQIDYSGAFSYSASEKTSGISQNSTSFVGCDSRKCCGCFGPVGGTKNYCGTECKAKSGGNISKNVYTWFWVRTSLPKRLWNKCMEYKVVVGEGKMAWYKLYDGNAVPVMGRCSEKEVLLNDGIIVVPDATAAQNVPPVPGLLEYRKDNKKLYIRSNETWNVVGEEQRILKETAEQLKIKLERAEEKINKLLNTSLADLKSQLQNVTKTVNDHIEKEKEYLSCLHALQDKSSAQNGVYRIQTKTPRLYSNVYCHMKSLPGCSGGGWTMVMKIDGNKETFSYSSSLWSNKKSYLLNNGMTGLDNKETKLATYWSTPFSQLCVGMKINNAVRFIQISYTRDSLYDIIADGKFRSTAIPRKTWKSLYIDSSFQRMCGRQGFNVVASESRHARVRIGIIGNEENNCHTVDSFIGFGAIEGRYRAYCGKQNIVNSCGNSAYCGADNGDKEVKAMGYIFVR